MDKKTGCSDWCKWASVCGKTWNNQRIFFRILSLFSFKRKDNWKRSRYWTLQWPHLLKRFLCIGTTICKEMSLDIAPFKYIQPLQCCVVFLHYLNSPHILFRKQAKLELSVLYKFIQLVLNTIWHTQWKITGFGGMQTKDVFSSLLLTGHLLLNKSLTFNSFIFFSIKLSGLVITPTLTL